MSAFVPTITLSDYFMGRDKLAPKELTRDVLFNAARLVQAVNSLLKSAAAEGIVLSPGKNGTLVSSGWRPKAINEQVGGATRSAHLTAEAVDLYDKDSKLGLFLTRRQEFLVVNGLYMEDIKHTPGWCHLQTRKTNSRIFSP